MRQLHPALLVHTTWLAGRRRLVAQSSSGRPPLVLNHPLALSALSALPGEFDREVAGDAWSTAGVPADAHDGLWAAFEQAELFADASSNGDSWWNELGWTEARAYHEATRDYPFIQMDQRDSFARDDARMEGYSSGFEPPPRYQQLGGEPTVDLDRLEAGESADDRLEAMSADQRLSLPGVGLLLDACFGERAAVRVVGGEISLLKSIPSGGARHPTEVFLASFELPGLDPGVYHFDVEHHRLDQVRGGQQREAFARSTLDLFGKYETPPAAALVFTSLVERAMWRYRDPRSFRAILVDVGHAVMAFRHVARMLGFRTYALQKMRDREVAELVAVDPVTQPPLYVGTLVR